MDKYVDFDDPLLENQLFANAHGLESGTLSREKKVLRISLTLISDRENKRIFFLIIFKRIK